MTFYLRHCAIGFALAAVFVAALLWLNVANLWSLISGSDIGLLAAFLLWFFNGIVFAGAQTGVAVMMMAEDPDDTPKGGSGDQVASHASVVEPVRVSQH